MKFIYQIAQLMQIININEFVSIVTLTNRDRVIKASLIERSHFEIQTRKENVTLVGFKLEERRKKWERNDLSNTWFRLMIW